MAKDKFETSLEKLESIVAALEEGNLSLEETLKKYEEGVALSRSCNKILQEAEKKIALLSKLDSGEFELKAFESSEEVEEKPKSTKSSRSKKGQEDSF